MTNNEKLLHYKSLKESRPLPHTHTMDEIVKMKSLPLYEIDSQGYEPQDDELFIYIEGDVILDTLDLDRLLEHSYGLMVTGNLTVNGGIYNLQVDKGGSLIVEKDVIADYVICGGGHIFFGGKATILGFVIGNTDYGTLYCDNLTALVEIVEGEMLEIDAQIPYRFNSFGDLETIYSTLELAKIFGKDNSFFEPKNYNDSFYFLLDAFNEAVLKDDIALLEQIVTHIEKELTPHLSLDERDDNDYNDKEGEEYDYEEENDDEEDYNEHNFKLYDISELSKLNVEVKQSKMLSNSSWQNIKVLFSKKGLEEVGLIATKIEKIVHSSDFNGIEIEDKNESLNELNTFAQSLYLFYVKQRNGLLYALLILIGTLLFFPSSKLLWFIIAWYLFLLAKKYRTYTKTQQWVQGAKEYILTAPLKKTSDKQEKKSDMINEVLDFLDYTSQQEKENWAVKLFDSVANLFTRKK